MGWKDNSWIIEIDGEWEFFKMEKGISKIWGGTLLNIIDSLWKEYRGLEIIMESSWEGRYFSLSCRW